MPIGSLRAALFAVFALVSSAVAQPALAGSITRDDFQFPKDKEVKVVVFRPDVQVGSLRVGGVDEPNADWTAAARTNIQSAMESAAEARAANMQFLDEYEGEQGKLVGEYRDLFETVAGSVFQHITLGDKLPTKQAMTADPKPKQYSRLDWTLGPEVARLKEVTGGDYALFFFTHDAYGDAGRKVAQFLLIALGSYVPAGIHVGYAALVDLETGNIVWFNTDLAMGGDPREVDGAKKRVSQLLAGFPSREGSLAATAKAKP
jgi:hypothetical protein